MRESTVKGCNLPCCLFLPHQVRVPMDEVPTVVRQLVDGQTSWQDVQQRYPAQQATAEEDGDTN